METRYAQAGPTAGNPTQNPNTFLILTVFDGNNRVSEINLCNLGKTRLTFGRSPENDIVLPSENRVVSRSHGTLEYTPQTGWIIRDSGSKNGLKKNGARVGSAQLVAGDIISIGRLNSPDDCVVLAFGPEGMRWNNVSLAGKNTFTIGRSPENDLVLPSSIVSSKHATILRSPSDGSFAIQDMNSYNGTFVMGRRVEGCQQIKPADFISIALTTLVFTGASLLYTTESRGVDVLAQNLVQIRNNHGKKRVTTDHVSLHIGRGEFVAIVGGSGSGKSTLLNELNGSDKAVEGSVFLDGIDLYANYESLKNAIGYVPQQDIVYDNLTLHDMLSYAAELRMPPDTTKPEREKRVDEVIDLLELSGEKSNYIGRLSGGQKKRASIAVELLADPRLLFLDEPTSGLDPGIERDLMHKLAAMAKDGRTIILVTHTTLNLHLCDQVVFLGAGGKLCYAGSPADTLAFFGVDDFVSIYNEVTRNPDAWAQRFANTRPQESPQLNFPEDRISPRRNISFGRQLSTLSRRYAKLVINDRQRLLLLILQAPILAALICLVAGNDCFEVCEKTKSCLFALSCAAFWVGILNSIQEICKERDILTREYAGGLKISAYITSKVLVLGVLCVIQAALLTGVFCAMKGLPPADPLFVNSGLELFITMVLLTLSAMCLGLWVSALFNNPDRAIAMAPILIMPQVLFSGLIFELKGAAHTISNFVNCRWGMEAFGATADLNSLDLKIYGEEVTIPASTQDVNGMEVEIEEQTREIDAEMFKHEPDSAYQHALSHLLMDWSVLAVFCVVCVLLSGITLKHTLRK
ncbi:MAG: FHA domain-containing protein [Eggerthellaceae bacterium]